MFNERRNGIAINMERQTRNDVFFTAPQLRVFGLASALSSFYPVAVIVVDQPFLEKACTF
jgi:hypothetical protein